MKINTKYYWDFKGMEDYIKKTHNKFFFLFKEKELEKLEKKLGIEFEWTPVKSKTGLPKDMEKNFIIIDFDRLHLAEIEKNDKNIKLLKSGMEIPDDKDCFCSAELYDNKFKILKKNGRRHKKNN